MATVQTRLGDIFDNQSDLVVLPCSAKGTISRLCRQHVERCGLLVPGIQALGGVSTNPFTGSGNITKLIAWAASVLDDYSHPVAIEAIGLALGQITVRDRRVRLIAAPLLGTGFGRLDNKIAAKALAGGFLSRAVTDATMIIYAYNQNTVDDVRSVLDQHVNSAPTGALLGHEQLSAPSTQRHEEQEPPKVFVCYARTDLQRAQEISHYLASNGAKPWLDKEQLLIGHIWQHEVKQAVERADAFVVCLSKKFDKIGFRQKEVKLALDVLEWRPTGSAFIIPFIIEPCERPSWCELIHAGEKPSTLEELLRAIETHCGWKRKSQE